MRDDSNSLTVLRNGNCFQKEAVGPSMGPRPRHLQNWRENGSQCIDFLFWEPWNFLTVPNN